MNSWMSAGFFSPGLRISCDGHNFLMLGDYLGGGQGGYSSGDQYYYYPQWAGYEQRQQLMKQVFSDIKLLLYEVIQLIFKDITYGAVPRTNESSSSVSLLRRTISSQTPLHSLLGVSPLYRNQKWLDLHLLRYVWRREKRRLSRSPHFTQRCTR